MDAGTSRHIYSVWGTDGDNVFATGDQGTVLHYNGRTWTALSTTSTQSLFSVGGNDGNAVFIAGAAGSILSYGPPSQ
jgi:photosystem II stability/assembly factor-like uncharacterized protein